MNFTNITNMSICKSYKIKEKTAICRPCWSPCQWLNDLYHCLSFIGYTSSLLYMLESTYQQGWWVRQPWSNNVIKGSLHRIYLGHRNFPSSIQAQCTADQFHVYTSWSVYATYNQDGGKRGCVPASCFYVKDQITKSFRLTHQTATFMEKSFSGDVLECQWLPILVGSP